MQKISAHEAAVFFDAEIFSPYRVQFNIIYQYLAVTEAVVIDEANRAAIVFPSTSIPIVWIDEGLFKEDAKRVIEELARYLFDEHIELEDIWISPLYAESFVGCYQKYFGCSYKEIVTQTAYVCNKLAEPEFSGRLLPAQAGNLNVVAGFMKNFEQECFHHDCDDGEILKKASDFIKTRLGFLWQDGDDFTALGFISHKSKSQGRINYIYVAEKFRGRGYAKMITAKLADIILAEGLKPVLYAIDGYAASNNAYKRIGFVPDKKTVRIAFEH